MNRPNVEFGRSRSRSRMWFVVAEAEVEAEAEAEYGIFSYEFTKFSEFIHVYFPQKYKAQFS